MSASALRLGAALAALLLLAGCETLRGLDAALTESEARADHAACASETVKFPSASYTNCRRLRANDRLEDVQRENMLNQQESSAYTAREAPIDPAGYMRTIDPERFHCYARGEGDQQLILCEER